LEHCPAAIIPGSGFYPRAGGAHLAGLKLAHQLDDLPWLHGNRAQLDVAAAIGHWLGHQR